MFAKEPLIIALFCGNESLWLFVYWDVMLCNGLDVLEDNWAVEQSLWLSRVKESLFDFQVAGYFRKRAPNHGALLRNWESLTFESQRESLWLSQSLWRVWEFVRFTNLTLTESLTFEGPFERLSLTLKERLPKGRVTSHTSDMRDSTLKSLDSRVSRVMSLVCDVTRVSHVTRMWRDSLTLKERLSKGLSIWPKTGPFRVVFWMIHFSTCCTKTHFLKTKTADQKHCEIWWHESGSEFHKASPIWWVVTTAAKFYLSQFETIPPWLRYHFETFLT